MKEEMIEFKTFINKEDKKFNQLKDNINNNRKVNLFVRQFGYLTKLVKSNGAFYDPYLNSPLNFQYHYSFLCASWCLLYQLGIMEDKANTILKVLNYWFNIPGKTKLTSLEFNNFALCLSYWILSDIESKDPNVKQIKAKLKNEIQNLNHRNLLSLKPLNNNFTALTALNLFFEGMINNNIKKMEQGKNLMHSKIINFQMDDGFFPDSNMSVDHSIEKNEGLPHLTYHAKIAMLVAFYAVIANDKRAKDAAVKAFENIVDIASPIGETCFYGRSQNALFGYACLFLGLNIVYKFIDKNEKYYILGKKILDLVADFSFPDGHFAINLNKKEKNRPGYDGYMYPVVYNTYANTLFLLGLFLTPEILIENDKRIENNLRGNNLTNIPHVTAYSNSGFLCVKERKFQFCLNFKGHLSCPKHFLDPRVAPLSLLYLNYEGVDFLPSIPYPKKSVSHLVKNPNIIERVQYLRKHTLDPTIGGFLPYFHKHDTNLLVIFNLIDISFDKKSNKLNANYSLLSIKKRNIFNTLIYTVFEKLNVEESNKEYEETILKTNINLSWKGNKIIYTINGPSETICFFPIRLYDDSKIKREQSKAIKIFYKNTEMRLLTNKPFMISKEKRIWSSKGCAKLFCLNFPDSNNIKIELVF
jgi:hypothetical protein